ncbi:MAG TPA: prolyl oligopeptidase family serine peptidase [Nocardioidaceae bacterium]|nr:prolyl oligopeptidase family serine peptidase [Nocardioidaceae bacterium]
MPEPTEDPYLWLEDVDGPEALAWVREQSTRTDVALAGTDGFAELERGLREVLDSDEKIPFARKVGDWYYNFWQDADHERGLWRRTTRDGYLADQTDWQTVLDLDALSAAEGETWVWHGATFLRPERTRVLVSLSRGGADADVTREFDLTSMSWVEDGFYRPEAKGDLGWVDADTVFVQTDFGDGSMTSSGYPRIVKRWRRGTPLADAVVVFEGRHEDLAVEGVHDQTPGYERDFVYRAVDFYTDELFLLEGDGRGGLRKLEAPDSADKSVHRDWLTVRLRDAWEVGGATYPSGALLVARLDDFLAGSRELEVVFTPDEHSSLESWTWTRTHLVLNTLVDVRHRLDVLTPESSDGDARLVWRRSEFVGAPESGTVAVSAVDAEESDEVWLTVTDFLTPTTLSLAEVGATPRAVKSAPAFFDGSAHVVEQHFATSKDGTRVPYFLVRPADLPADASTPTLLHGYGGYEVSEMPAYSGLIGRGWLAGGRAYAVANIRGGGEYGPRWHHAALRENRHRAYEDFAAVAQDLVDRKITSPEHLGARGGSNGGLLMGNMLTQFPELFGALVCYVPVLDMRRYTKLLAGASWIAEWGDPDDPDDWAHLRTYSPYHLHDPARDYPPTLIWTTTRDDRVHPGHARKMAAKMLEAGQQVRYFENVEGGHGAGTTPAQSAHVWALSYAFLRSVLG